ncbi:MAG: S16 family serine protease [Candidatus Aenigmatarchaeota archaeon]
MRRKPFLRPLDVFLILVIGLMAGALVGLGMQAAQPKLEPTVGYTVTMAVPAVDNKGNGVATSLVVETKKGNGKTLANIDVLLFWVDTQQSIQTARGVAEEITGIGTGSIDLIYGIDARNVSLVGGPSAGAALTVATIAALRGEQPKGDVMITGTIEANGTIGPVGGILEKARAAKAAGMTVFLVPTGESVESVTEPVETCTKKPGFVYCEKTYKRRLINVSDEVGITVKEVSDINDALPYFFQ